MDIRFVLVINTFIVAIYSKISFNNLIRQIIFNFQIFEKTKISISECYKFNAKIFIKIKKFYQCKDENLNKKNCKI